MVFRPWAQAGRPTGAPPTARPPATAVLRKSRRVQGAALGCSAMVSSWGKLRGNWQELYMPRSRCQRLIGPKTLTA